MKEKDMLAAASRTNSRGIWQGTILGFKLTQGLKPAMSRVNVRHDDTAVRSGDEADIRVQRTLPPLFNRCHVHCSVFQSVGCEGMLCGIVAGRIPTGASAAFKPPVDGNHEPAATGGIKSRT